MSLLFLAMTAAAVTPPPINVQLYHVSVDGRTGLSLDDARIGPDGAWSARAVVQYLNDPLVFLTTDGVETSGLGNVVATDLVGGWSWGRWRVGADVPVYPWASGAAVDSGALVGDVALDARWVALDPDGTRLGVAPTVRIAMPTAGERAPLGARGFDGALGVAVSQRFGDWSAAGNIAAHLVPGLDTAEAKWGSRLDVRAGASRDLSGVFGVTGELALAPVFAATGSTAGWPAEALVGGWVRLPADLAVRGAVGTGLTRGVGAPDARVLLAVGWEPPLVRDRDRDGILDPADACVSAAEDVDGTADMDGCPDPDNDADGIPDVTDACANQAEDVDGFEDIDGCPDLDNDKDGVLDPADACPLVAEDPDGWKDEDGCADPVVEVTFRVTGTDGRALPDARLVLEPDVRTLQAGVVEALPAGSAKGVAKALDYQEASWTLTVVNGPPLQLDITLTPAPPPAPTSKNRVVVTRDSIQIVDKVYFATGKATIQKQSFSLLDELAAVLVAHPEILRVRVEGHTDDVGKAASNLKLSQGRADAVNIYLAKKGVAAGRLVSVGYGSTRPVDVSRTRAAREQNRRVAFVIEERAPLP